ncbi:hypothetical protein QUA41_04910 [Microcoleus sp. Pol11C1]|uniref:hypothetical protein n=1 Tax=unclassified Microcoleus TaxID=2642155 RepID=UPI002FD4650B
MVILAATSIYFSDRAFTLSRTSSPGTSRFYCPRPGLQSTKPNASVSRKLAIEMAITAAIGYSILLGYGKRAIVQIIRKADELSLTC